MYANSFSLRLQREKKTRPTVETFVSRGKFKILVVAAEDCADFAEKKNFSSRREKQKKVFCPPPTIAH